MRLRIGERLRHILPRLASLLPASTKFIWRKPHYIIAISETIVSRLCWAIRQEAETALEELTGRKWELWANAAEAQRVQREAKRSAPLQDLTVVGALHFGSSDASE